MRQNYPNESVDQEKLLNTMVGDMQRVKFYGENGYQASQEIPPEVWSAHEALISAGYTKHVIQKG